MSVVALGMALLFVGTERRYLTAPDPAHGNILAALAGVSWAFTLMGLRGWDARRARGAAPPPRSRARELHGVLRGAALRAAVHAARPLDWAIVTGLGTIQVVWPTSSDLRMRQVRALEASMLLLLEPVLNPVWSGSSMARAGGGRWWGRHHPRRNAGEDVAGFAADHSPMAGRRG